MIQLYHLNSKLTRTNLEAKNTTCKTYIKTENKKSNTKNENEQKLTYSN